MKLTDISRLAAQLDGVTERRHESLLTWRYRGRLVARQLDDIRIVIRTEFDARVAAPDFPFRACYLPRRLPASHGLQVVVSGH